MSRDTWCKHYRAMAHHDTCLAGVPFDKFKGMPFDSRPCFNVCPEHCDAAVYRSPEEIAEEKAEMDERFAKVMAARNAIVEHLGEWKRGKTPGQEGTIDCPACGATLSLRFTRSGYNGHIHAACKTQGCVRWME